MEQRVADTLERLQLERQFQSVADRLELPSAGGVAELGRVGVEITMDAELHARLLDPFADRSPCGLVELLESERAAIALDSDPCVWKIQ